MRYLAFILICLTLTGCRDNSRVSVKCKYTGIDQADFLIFSTDGGIQDIDTLHLKKGRAEKEWKLNDTATFTILYPNYQQLTFRAAPGDEIEIEGDAQDLQNVKVTPLYPLPKAKEMSKRPSVFKINTKGMTDMDGKSITIDKEKYLILNFWCNWRSAAGAANTGTSRALNEHADKLQALSVSLDPDTTLCRNGMLRDRTTWHFFCDGQSWQTPLAKQFQVDNVPYTFLLSPKGKVIAEGTNFQRDILPAIDKLK